MDSPRLGPLSSCAKWPALAIFPFYFLGLIACGDDGPLTTARYRLVGPPAFDDGCPTLFAPGPVEFDVPATSARFTYLEPSGELVCDAVIPNAAGAPAIAVPTTGAELDVYVELFGEVDGVVTLIGTGVARADLEAGGTIDIMVLPRERFACARDHVRTSRAFHTTTVLADGRVLVIGGLVADPQDDTDIVNTGYELFVTPSVELFDPATRRFSQISVAGLTPRALHHAVVLDNGDIALLGGVTVIGDPQSTAAMTMGTAYRLEPTASTRAADPQLLRYDAQTGTVTVVSSPELAMLAPRMFAGVSTDVVASGARAVSAGGVANGMQMTAPELGYDLLDPATGTTRTGNALVVARMGASATSLPDGTALVWGGHVGAAAADLQAQAGELVTGLTGDMPAAMLMGYNAAGDLPTARVFHAAARAGDGSVVVAGGYGIDPMLTNAPLDGVFAQHVVPGGTATVTSLAISGGGAPDPAVYVDALSLSDGDVLISGGSPPIGIGVCPDTANGLLCTTPAAYRFRVDGTALDGLGSMLIGRYGHRAAVLRDDTVLITGGLTSDGINLWVVDDVEVFDPREEADDPLADLAPAITRAPGDVARAGADPYLPCTLIETVGPD